MSDTPRRDPVPDSAKYYLRNGGDNTRSAGDRLFSMREAFNHLENAAWAEAATGGPINLRRCAR